MRAPEHICEFTVYSHTSYGVDDIADVFLCSEPTCPAWDYGPRRPYSDDLVGRRSRDANHQKDHG